jgi:hypothetical protein
MIGPTAEELDRFATRFFARRRGKTRDELIDLSRCMLDRAAASVPGGVEPEVMAQAIEIWDRIIDAVLIAEAEAAL